jgi:hypothetical protein
MKLIIKIATLLLFISGIVFFVGYQSGYFFPATTKEPSTPGRNEIKSAIESAIVDTDTTNEEKIDTIAVAPSVKTITQNGRHVPKKRTTEQKEEVKEVDLNKLRMYSSKSLVVQPLLNINEVRMSSSKSFIPRRSFADIFKPQFFKQENPLEDRIKIDTTKPPFNPDTFEPYDFDQKRKK